MKKRIISSVLVFAMMLSLLPMPAMAALGSRSAEVSEEPYLKVEKPLVGEGTIIKPQNAPEGSAVYFAYYNADGRMLDIEIWTVDSNSHKFAGHEDAKYAKAFLLDKSTGGPLTSAQKILLNTETYTVTFYDGKNVIDIMEVEEGQPLGAVPSADKSSKSDGILVGYFSDKDCTQPFYAEEPVTEDLKVYAKYEESPSGEEITPLSYARMDQAPDLSYTITGKGDPEQAVTLEVKDGSDPVALDFKAVGGNYEVYAPDGFNEGASYQIHLADGWSFVNDEGEVMPDSIRTSSFSIAKEEVKNIQMSDEIIYIQDTAAMKYTVGGKTVDVLTSEYVTEAGGTFNYSGSALPVGAILGIYEGKHPDQRDTSKSEDNLLALVYVKVAAVSGSTVTFEPMSAEDQQKLYDIPDNFPIKVAELPSGKTGTVNIKDLDTAMYATMMSGGNDSQVYDLAKAKSVINEGDFVTLYISQSSIQSEADLYYAEVTGYDAATGEITYGETTREAILESMDLYSKVAVEADDYITEEEKEAIERTVLNQVEESGFVEEAGLALANMITESGEVSLPQGMQNMVLTDESGEEISLEDMQRMNFAYNFEVTEDMKGSVEVITQGDDLRYDGGVRINVGIEGTLEAELESEDKVVINLEATFTQEVVLDPMVKGEMVYKEILWIPIPIGVKVGATIDILSFSAFSFEAEVLTVPAEDPDLLTQFTTLVNNPEKLADFPGLPPEISDGLKTAGDLFDKVEEIKNDIAKVAQDAEDAVEQIQGYQEDLETLWAFIEKKGYSTQENYEDLCKQLSKTNVTSELMAMLNMEPIENGERNAQYYDSLDALMARYAEMLEQETDWITLVEAEMGKVEAQVKGVCIGVEFTFMTRADMSLAIGSNLQYEVGKRYEFWFKIGLFKPSSGSTTMDLLDETFAFQFYAMGRLGLKMGVEAFAYVGIGTGDVCQVGITLEIGPYVKLYGYFIYEYDQIRGANTITWTSNERMTGALFLEFGLYLMMGVQASAGKDVFETSFDFLDEEFPLLTAGEQRHFYRFNYQVEQGEAVVIQNKGQQFMPSGILNLAFVDLVTGMTGYQTLQPKDMICTVSNPNFIYYPDSNNMIVKVPDGTRYMECDLTLTYKYGKMAFSTYDMSVTIPVVWTNLSTTELKEFYTASVRVGNGDNYTTVWTQKVLKGTPFDLPTEDQVKELMGWNDYAHTMGTGYGSQQLEGLTLIEDEVYDFDIDYKTYPIEVNGIVSADGSQTSKTYYAKFGQAFDFSDLIGTGKSSGGEYTIFANLTPSDPNVDLNDPINSKFVQALNSGLTATANYADNSVMATFTFIGLNHTDVKIPVEKGAEPDLSQIEAIVSDYGMALKDITPVVGPITAATTYQVIVGELEGDSATISFQENGGSEVADITKVIGSLIGNLPVPTRTGYDFVGWYADKDLTTPFEGRKIPEGGQTLYAKWTPNAYTVTFRVNGGNNLPEGQGTKTVAYDSPYGELPAPTRTGFGFAGWFTAAEGGEQITADTKVTTPGNVTLYAQWRELIEIPTTVFQFDFYNTNYQPIYKKGVAQPMPEGGCTFTPEEGAAYTQDQFTFWYKHTEDGTDWTTEPVNAGDYDVMVTRPADNTYAKFEHVYSTSTKHYTIQKAVHDTVGEIPVEVTAGLTYLELKLVNDGTMTNSGLYDVSERTQIAVEYFAGGKDAVSTAKVHKDGTIRIDGLTPGNTGFSGKLKVYDPNYKSSTSSFYYPTGKIYPYGVPDGTTFDSLMAHPTGSWLDAGNYDTSWYTEGITEVPISTAAQLAGLAYLVNSGVDFTGTAIWLTDDLDLSAHEWVPMGTSSSPFRGLFDGQGYTISGLYVNQPEQSYVGLFGCVTAVAEMTKLISMMPLLFEVNVEAPTIIRNVVMDDAYISGNGNVGGIVGYGAPIITGTYSSYKSSLVFNTPILQIDNCVSHAVVNAAGGNAGGIAGRLDSYSGTEVINCVNYGTVTCTQPNVGGIVGYNGNANTLDGKYVGGGNVVNCANFGAVNGGNNVAGIVGTNYGERTNVLNNYSCGAVKGTGTDYIGAIVGRNTSDYGTVINGFYLAGSAKAGNDTRTALGMSGGAVADGGEKYPSVSSFQSPSSLLGGDLSSGGNTLINTLNAWVESEDAANYGAASWVAEPDSYPLPEGLPVSALR